MRSTARAPAAQLGRAGAVGERLAPRTSAPLALRFSDGSQVTLPPQAQAHVDALDAHGATVALEEGTVEVSVVHRAHTRWEIRAGRYHIRVTGTRFAAGWDRAHRLADGDDARGFGRGHRAGPEGAGAGRDRPAAARERRDRGRAGGDEPEVVVEDATSWRRTPRRRAGGANRGGRAGRSGPSPRSTRGSGGARARRPPRASRSRPRRSAAPPIARGARSCAVEARARRRRMAGAGGAGPVQGSARGGGRATDSTTSCLRLPAEDVLKLGETARLAGDAKRAEYAYQAANRRFPSTRRPGAVRPRKDCLRSAAGLRLGRQVVRPLRETFPARPARARGGRPSAGVADQSRRQCRSTRRRRPLPGQSSRPGRTPNWLATPRRSLICLLFVLAAAASPVAPAGARPDAALTGGHHGDVASARRPAGG